MLIAVDTGATKTLIAGFLATGELVGDPIKFPTPKDQSQYAKVLAANIKSNFSVSDIKALSLALPGVIAKDGTAMWCDNLGWKDFKVSESLAEHFNVPIIVENDANLAGLFEANQLNPVPETVLYITISTGIGTGVITKGNIDTSLKNAEGGHIKLDYKGVLTEWEDFASGHSISETYGKYARDIEDTKTWSEISDLFVRGFLAIIPIIRPDTIIIGGSVGTHFEKYGNLLKQALADNLPSHIILPLVTKATRPEEAVIYGCYLYAKQQIDTF